MDFHIIMYELMYVREDDWDQDGVFLEIWTKSNHNNVWPITRWTRANRKNDKN